MITNLIATAILLICAVVCIVVGVFSLGDPEGRGRKIALGCAVAALAEFACIAWVWLS